MSQKNPAYRIYRVKVSELNPYSLDICRIVSCHYPLGELMNSLFTFELTTKTSIAQISSNGRISFSPRYLNVDIPVSLAQSVYNFTLPMFNFRISLKYQSWQTLYCSTKSSISKQLSATVSSYHCFSCISF